MYIIIAGGGVAGSVLAAELVNRKHDVVVMDTDRQACEELYAQTGAVTICGKATEIGPLKEAGVEKADLAVGALYKDVHNLTFALLSHACGVKNIIVKMRDPGYEEAYKMAGATIICDMIGMFRTRVLAEIETPDIKIITPLHNRQAWMIMIQIPHSLPMDGTLIQDLVKIPAFASGCIFTGILTKKDDKMIVPHGGDRIFPGDRLFMVADNKNLKTISGFLKGKK